MLLGATISPNLIGRALARLLMAYEFGDTARLRAELYSIMFQDRLPDAGATFFMIRP